MNPVHTWPSAFLVLLGSCLYPSLVFAQTCNQTFCGLGTVANYPAGACPDVQPQPSPPYEPGQNGCGPTDSALKSAAIGSIAGYGVVSFQPACNVHDNCYGTCNPQDATGSTTGKDSCDLIFQDNVQGLCREGYDPLIHPLDYAACILVAKSFYEAVHIGGNTSYAEGQVEGCGCCDDCYCAALTCTPAQILNRDTCTCECAPCPDGQHADPATCKCLPNNCHSPAQWESTAPPYSCGTCVVFSGGALGLSGCDCYPANSDPNDPNFFASIFITALIGTASACGTDTSDPVFTSNPVVLAVDSCPSTASVSCIPGTLGDGVGVVPTVGCHVTVAGACP